MMIGVAPVRVIPVLEDSEYVTHISIIIRL